jgi:formiminotetrahydrofolate cyclodeaminase
MGDTDFPDVNLGDLLGGFSVESRAPGGGAAAAVTATIAAGLIRMVAQRSSGSWDDAAGVVAQARALQARCAPLADADAQAWRKAFDAMRGDVPDGIGLEEKLAGAVEPLLLIASTAADVAALAATVAERGEGAFRADAAAAAVLAEAAARAAAHLVAINLAVTEHDPRLAHARLLEEAAAEAARRALDAGP